MNSVSLSSTCSAICNRKLNGNGGIIVIFRHFPAVTEIILKKKIQIQIALYFSGLLFKTENYCYLVPMSQLYFSYRVLKRCVCLVGDENPFTTIKLTHLLEATQRICSYIRMLDCRDMSKPFHHSKTNEGTVTSATVFTVNILI